MIQLGWGNKSGRYQNTNTELRESTRQLPGPDKFSLTSWQRVKRMSLAEDLIKVRPKTKLRFRNPQKSLLYWCNKNVARHDCIFRISIYMASK